MQTGFRQETDTVPASRRRANEDGCRKAAIATDQQHNRQQGGYQMETITISALRRAIEGRDGKTLAGFYADDAVMQIIDQNNPPSRPFEVKGHDAIAAYFDDVCGRAMTHRVESGVAEGDRIAFTQACTYPDGNRVFCSATLELAGGKIARQISIQAWDP
jgi:ketosteroid isomerase-like protein